MPIGVDCEPCVVPGPWRLAIANGSYNSYMKETATREAKNRFGYLLDAAQSAPVRVTRNGRAVGVVMSMSSMSGFGAPRGSV